MKKEKKVGGSDSIVSVYESSSTEGGGVIGDVLQNISNVIANVETTLLETIQQNFVVQISYCYADFT